MAEENVPRVRHTGTGNTHARWLIRNVPDRNFEFILKSHGDTYTFIIAEGDEIQVAQGRRRREFRYTRLSRALFTRFLLRPSSEMERKLVHAVHRLLNQIAQRSLHEIHPFIPMGTHLPFEMVESLQEICDRLHINRETLP